MRAQTVNLNGTWSVVPAGIASEGEAGLRRIKRLRKGRLKARVPGEIHLDLVRAGRMDEPLEGGNITRCRWPETKSWWYRRTFNCPRSLLQHERQRIIFDGLDLYAQVFLNGAFLGSAANAFIPACFDAKSFLKRGRNEIVVRLTAGSELAKDAAGPGTVPDKNWENPAKHGRIPNPARRDSLHGHRLWSGLKWLRKPAFAYGWDWIDPLPNIGITDGVRIEGRSGVVIYDLHLDTFVERGKTFLKGQAVLENLHPWQERACVLEVRVAPPKGGGTIKLRTDLGMQVGRYPVPLCIKIPKPRLWWPNGMGEQPLYHVAARVLTGRTETDRREFDIGLRTIEIDRSPLAGGSRFCVKVNGEEVFCKGGNWGPSDAILPRVGRQKYERLVAEARDAHFNMFRVNGVGTYEKEAFYDACDRAGILVWQDFTFSCHTYPDHDPAFRRAVREEAEAVVASLRHHPCIALWCGTNENIWGFADWWGNDQTKPQHTGGSIVYNQILPDVCERLDPRRLYWPCSPFGGERPNSELSGDCHWWLQAYMNSDPNRWADHETYDECRSRFVSEFGAIGPCHMDSIRQYLPPGERSLDHRSRKFHTNTFGQGRIVEAIRRLYTEPEGLKPADFVLYGQMCQAELLGRAVEAFRFRKGAGREECQGVLVWSYSDCWGEAGWSIIDHYCRRKAAWYRYRSACKPVKVIVRRRGRKLATRVVNDTRRSCKVTVKFGWYRLDGADRRVKSKRVSVPANGAVDVGEDAIPAKREIDPRQWVYGAVMRGGAVEDQCVWTLLPQRELAVVRPDLRTTKKTGGWKIVSSVYCHGLHFNDHGRAVLSDNHFDLLPGVPRTLTRVDGKRGLPKLRALTPRL